MDIHPWQIVRSIKTKKLFIVMNGVLYSGTKNRYIWIVPKDDMDQYYKDGKDFPTCWYMPRDLLEDTGQTYGPHKKIQNPWFI